LDGKKGWKMRDKTEKRKKWKITQIKMKETIDEEW
jgi:hypothetical protein